jgi:hypothetical protein
MSRKEYQKNYQRNWLRKRREDFFSNKSCVLCGSTAHLELDHINPEEKITHNVWSRNEKFRNEELSKCQVLCKSCHKQKSIDYFKFLYTGKDLKANQKIPDELFLQVIELNKTGLSLRKACKQLNISYSTFSSTKCQNKRVFK